MKANSNFSELDGNQTKGYSALKIIAAYKKVLGLLEGKIPVPEVVEIFPTNYCDFSCSHCRCKNSHSDIGKYMEFAVFEKLLTDLSEKGVNTLEFSGGGEPLIHPKINEMFDLIKKKGFRVGIITNGYSLIGNSALQKKMLDSCDWIRFSVDGFSNETYRKIHGKNNLKYSELRNMIANMVRRKGISSIGMKMLISKKNIHEIDLAISEAEELQPHYLQFKFLGESELEVPNRLTHERELERKIAKLKNRKVSYEFSPSYAGEKEYGSCTLNALHPVINFDGTIYLCAFFNYRMKEHSIGNIYDGGFFNHWDSEKHKKAMKRIDINKCISNCPISRYNPVVEFIKQNSNHFKYI